MAILAMLRYLIGGVAPGMYGKVMAGGKDVGTLAPEEAKKVLLKGFEELIDRYGKSKGLNLANHSWARKLEFLIPHKPNFTYWEDARNCGKLVLE